MRPTFLTPLAALLLCGEPRPLAVQQQVADQRGASLDGVGLPSHSGIPWDPPPALVDALRAAELARDATGPRLAAALAGADPRGRTAAARSLARIGAPEVAQTLLAALEQSEREPDAGLIAAVGLLEPWPGAPGEAREPDGLWQALEQHLWTRYAVSEDLATADATIWALARLGGRHSQRLFAVEVSAAIDDVDRRASVWEAVGVACARRHPLAAAILEPLGEAVAGPSSPARAAALFALGRCVTPSAELFAGPERAAWVERLGRATASSDPDEARLAWKALAALGEIPSTVLPWWSDDVAPEVAVEAVRALAGHASTRADVVDQFVASDPSVWQGARAHVLLVGLQSLRGAVEAAPELVAKLRRFDARLAGTSPSDLRMRKIIDLARCEIAALVAVTDGNVAPVETCVTGGSLPTTHGVSVAIEIVARSATPARARQRADALVAWAGDARPAVAAPALAALADVEDPRVSAVLRDALASDDVGALAAATNAIAARAADRDRRDPAAVPALEGLLGRVDSDHAMEARLGAIEALGALARSNAEPRARPAEPDAGPVLPTTATAAEAPVWLARTLVPLCADRSDAIRRAAWAALAGWPELREQFLQGLPIAFPEGFAHAVEEAAAKPRAAGMRLHTEAGAIEIAFAGAPAPIAQAVLVDLARARRFDGLRFHRVVPGFVVQGGDPRGDGYGGPGFVIPCEWSDVRYERGVVGIALAGKDTGGSQFFVAQTRQPHLDGRFSVVGRVRPEDLDVVDRILPHDTIERIEVIEAP